MEIKYSFRDVYTLKDLPLKILNYFTTGNEDRILYEIRSETRLVGYIVRIPSSFPYKHSHEWVTFPQRKTDEKFLRNIIERGELDKW